MKEVVSLRISNEATVRSFWKYFDMGEYDEAAKLMAPEAVVQWCNTRETFKNRDNFILANKKYPGKWRITVERMITMGDSVITVVKADSSEPFASFYATSFFKLANNGLIKELVEYWGENGEPPEWRIKEELTERY